MDTIPLCERCGEPFARTQGSSGRFCSRACYQGELSIDDRRAAILEALKSGPRWATRLRVGVLASVTNGTIHNDLAYLRKQGLVENGDDGWQLVATSEPEASPVPLAQSRETPATFPTSRPSNWH